MKIYIDADSCPRVVRDVVLRASNRCGIQAVFVANKPVDITEGDWAAMEITSAADGAADDRIVALAAAGDIAITRDVPLAKRLVDNNVAVLDDKGRIFTPDNINTLLSIRDFTVELAGYSDTVVRTDSYSKKDLALFANSFDKLLTRLSRAKSS